MKCPICKVTSWEKVDEYRLKPQGMSMCTGCGFVSYPDKYKKKEDVIQYYRSQYRGTPPKVHNLFTGQNKLHYHEWFLADLVKDWIAAGKKDPVICDTGAAFGLFLSWWRNVRDKEGNLAFPQATLTGTELTTTFRRVAYHEYGHLLTEDFDATKKYDFISSYKVAEHIYDIDEELARYREALKPDGRLYISVPVWFYRMHNFGAAGWDIEYYYHPDHCNVWSTGHFEKLLAASGFKVLKRDYDVYDATYLCELGEDTPATAALPPQQVKAALKAIYQANDLTAKRDFDGAVAAWPNFPVARRAAYEFRRAEYHRKGYAAIRDAVIKPWLALDPLGYDALGFAADLSLRYKQFDEAEHYCKTALNGRPISEQFLTQLGNVYRTKANDAKTEAERQQALVNARECARLVKAHCLAGFQNAVTWIFNDCAQLPIPGE